MPREWNERGESSSRPTYIELCRIDSPEDTEARAEAAEIAAFAGQMGRSRRKGLAMGASVGVLAVLILLVGGLAIRQRSIRRANHGRQCGQVIIENGHEVVFAPDDCRDVHGNPIEEP